MNSYGVAGYRIDAAKHMYPGDIEKIWTSLDYLRQDHFGLNKKPYFYLEVAYRHYVLLKYPLVESAHHSIRNNIITEIALPKQYIIY